MLYFFRGGCSAIQAPGAAPRVDPHPQRAPRGGSQRRTHHSRNGFGKSSADYFFSDSERVLRPDAMETPKPPESGCFLHEDPLLVEKQSRYGNKKFYAFNVSGSLYALSESICSSVFSELLDWRHLVPRHRRRSVVVLQGIRLGRILLFPGDESYSPHLHHKGVFAYGRWGHLWEK